MRAAKWTREVAKAMSSKYVLSPLETPWLKNWDLLCVLSLVFVCFVTPYEVVFLEMDLEGGALNYLRDPLFMVNRFVDSIFVVDMILQFFVAYQTGSALGGYTWVLHHPDIVKHCTLIPLANLTRARSKAHGARPARSSDPSFALSLALQI